MERASRTKAQDIDMGQVNGSVKWFSQQKGYGFARLEDGREVFIHATSLQDGRNDLNDGEPISGRLFSGARGLKLREVHVRS